MVYGKRKRTVRDICGTREVVESDCKTLGLRRWKTKFDENNALIEALHRNDPKGVREAVERGADVNARDGTRFGSPAITHCLDNLEILKFLIERGADVNCDNYKGQSPLAWAIMDNNKDAVELLIENGADVNGTFGRGGVSLLALAEQVGSQMADILRKHGAVYQEGELKK